MDLLFLQAGFTGSWQHSMVWVVLCLARCSLSVASLKFLVAAGGSREKICGSCGGGAWCSAPTPAILRQNFLDVLGRGPGS